MASRKRRTRPLASPRRKRRSTLPILENLESRIVLSQVLPPNPNATGSLSLLPSPHDGLVPYPLASGGMGWLSMPGATGSLAGGQAGSSGTGSGTTPAQPFDPGVILGHVPVASPFDGGPSQQFPGPAGYTPVQIQTAYGVNQISFAGIKGDGTGQTIGIFEEGYNPAFVDTSDPGYSTSALAEFDKTFGLPDPPSLTFVDHNGVPLSSSNNATNNPDFQNYGAGPEIALDIEWAHAMAPGANIVVLSATPIPPYYQDITNGIATLAGMPGMSVISASYGPFLDASGQEALEQSWDSTILQPARCQPGRERLRRLGRQRDGLRADLPVGLARGRLGRRHQPVPQRRQHVQQRGRLGHPRRSVLWQRRRLQQGVPHPLLPADGRLRGQQRLSHQSRHRRRRRPEYRRGGLRPVRLRHGHPVGASRRHERGDAVVGRHGLDRRPGPRAGRRLAAGFHGDADGPLHAQQDRAGRLPRHHHGQ